MLRVFRCDVVAKDAVGAIHFHRRWWRPGKVSEVLFQPEGRAVAYPVPEESWQQVLEAGSMEQAMAPLRKAGVQAVKAHP